MNNIFIPTFTSLFSQELIQFCKYHLISIITVFLVLITILVHKRGSSTNRLIAIKYQQLISPLLSQFFRKYDGQLVYQSPNIFKLYPSDRDTCLFAIISFALVPRQQIISFLMNPIFIRLKDELVLEIPINNQNPLFMTSAIVRKQNVKAITKKSFPDIKQLCKQYRPVSKSEAPQNNQTKLNVPNSHCILVEKTDHVRYFIYSTKQAELWKLHGKSVKMVYMSDVNKFSRYPMAARMVMNLNQEDIPPMLQWFISFVDRMAKARMSPGQRKEAQNKRKTLNISYE